MEPVQSVSIVKATYTSKTNLVVGMDHPKIESSGEQAKTVKGEDLSPIFLVFLLFYVRNKELKPVSRITLQCQATENSNSN